MVSSELKKLMTYNSEERIRPPISYKADITALPKHIVAKYHPLEKDEETAGWLKDAADVSLLKILICGVLRRFVSLTTANGIVGRGGMFVMSTAQAAKLLLGHVAASQWIRVRERVDPPFEALLDIGAGDGGVTSRLQPLFKRVAVTEFSLSMRWRLWWRGYKVLPHQDPFTHADGSRRLYNVVSCLNVLDRADTPLDMLKSVRDSLAPGGVLLLAVVLPWCPFVEDGSAKRPPVQKLPMEGGECCKGATFEQSLRCLLENVLLPCGFQLERWCKLPYLSEGSLFVEYAVLHDAVMVLTRREENAGDSVGKCANGGSLDT